MKIYDYLNRFLIINSFGFYDLLLNQFNLVFLHLLDNLVLVLFFFIIFFS